MALKIDEAKTLEELRVQFSKRVREYSVNNLIQLIMINDVNAKENEWKFGNEWEIEYSKMICDECQNELSSRNEDVIWKGIMEGVNLCG